MLDSLSAPLSVSWQLTQDCNLSCLHCCTESAVGRKAPDELGTEEALRLAGEIVRSGVPTVTLCGGEPLVSPYFWDVAESLGSAGVHLKVETNGQSFGRKEAHRLAKLPIRSVQVSLDANTQVSYGRLRPGASLARAHAACRAVREAGLPLEITFAPTRFNIPEARLVIDRAVRFGAIRFNTGKLMRLGNAVKTWDTLEPTPWSYRVFFETLEFAEKRYKERIEICFRPVSLEDEMTLRLKEPAASLLILPDGKVKVAAVLPYICADMRRHSIKDAWDLYRKAWKESRVREAAQRFIDGLQPGTSAEARNDLADRVAVAA